MDWNFTIFAAVMLLVWSMQLITGKAYERLGPPTDRQKNPVHFWFSILVQFAMIGFVFWLRFRGH